jgi:hypothetical protein
MTSKEQKKLQKSKARDKENRKKILVRREKLRAPIREEKKEILREKRIRKIQRELEQFDQVMSERELFDLNDNTLDQLEKNIMILKALEDDHNRNYEKKKKLNEQLESEGYYTLEDKMKAARELLGGDMGVGGSAEASYSGNNEIKGTADVSVIKAPSVEFTENS